MREQSGSIASTIRPTLQVCPSLTPSQVAVLRKSWKHINTKGLITVLSRCFQRLESSCPVVSQCFSSSQQELSTVHQCSVRTVAEHARFLLSMLDKIIDSEQDLEEIREIGARHCILNQRCGFGTAELDRFQEIFVEVILKQDGVRQSKEASRAWRILICSIVDLFRDGFEAQLRQLRRKHSFNAHTRYFENIERRVSNCSQRKASLNVESKADNCVRKISQLDF
ncbi:Glb-27p [Parelaphostrongylus tenuis]|uniref:Glb-27p n=1 Tax=Parelaphostrongylus tenuis TaxID=148309 RepID=A0AAD5LV92_PARTN|nr:Glb-27p [Parelaphostrongylus tenuis]